MKRDSFNMSTQLTMASSPSLLIFGGAGFLGQRIAQSALAKGWQVTSVTRSGAPPASSEVRDDPAWKGKVHWIKGDAFDATSYRAELRTVNHIVSTIGILDYRGIRKQETLRHRVDALGSTFYDAVQDIFPGRSAKATDEAPALQIYDRLNRDSLKCIADEVYESAQAPASKLQSFAYVSAADGFPGIPKRYITSKREAEEYLQAKAALLSQKSTLRTIIYRPGFMYADSNPMLSTLSNIVGATYALNSSFGLSKKLASLTNGNLSLGAAGIKPLPVARVADAIVEGCLLADGILDVYKIEALADVRWRQEMIV
jgi:hypothetical protein